MAKDASINPFGRRFWHRLYDRIGFRRAPGAVQTPKKDPTKAGQAGRNIAGRGDALKGLL
jgi:cation transport regulator ChaC